MTECKVTNNVWIKKEERKPTKGSCPLEEREKELTPSEKESNLITASLWGIRKGLIAKNPYPKEIMNYDFYNDILKEMDNKFINRYDPIALREAGLVKVEDLKNKFIDLDISEIISYLYKQCNIKDDKLEYIENDIKDILYRRLLELLGDKDE